MPAERHVVLQAVAARIAPGMRVGIDGVSAAGKTTFADALAALLDEPVTRLSIDDFHNPPELRYARGEGADSYYDDTFDIDAFRAAVAATDRTTVVDGIFIHKPALRDLWDLSVFLTGDRDTLLERAIARDSAWMPSAAAARERYATRYFPGETRYLEEVGPERLATLVIDNTDPARPRLVIDSDP